MITEKELYGKKVKYFNNLKVDFILSSLSKMSKRDFCIDYGFSEDEITNLFEELNIPISKEIKIISVNAKCPDLCFTKLETEKGIVLEHGGGVIDGLGVGYGDYIKLEINAETGQILNWKKPNLKDIEYLLTNKSLTNYID
jgi:hypothetical protein